MPIFFINFAIDFCARFWNPIFSSSIFLIIFKFDDIFLDQFQILMLAFWIDLKFMSIFLINFKFLVQIFAPFQFSRQLFAAISNLCPIFLSIFNLHFSIFPFFNQFFILVELNLFHIFASTAHLM